MAVSVMLWSFIKLAEKSFAAHFLILFHYTAHANNMVWLFIFLHNVQRSAGGTEPQLVHAGRVYTGISLPSGQRVELLRRLCSISRSCCRAQAPG